MAENTPAETTVQPTSQAPAASGSPAPARQAPVAGAERHSAPTGSEPLLAAPGVRLDDVPTPYAARRPRPVPAWIIIAAASLLVVVLVFLAIRPRRQALPAGGASEAVGSPETADLANYREFVARNKALIEPAYAERVLTDEPFAGQAPLAVRDSGPLVSAAADPQLAALVDALRIRAHVMQGSQSLLRNQTQSRVTRGEVRGFRVQALEKIENGRVVAEEAQVTTPRNGLIKTVGRVLSVLQRTDLPAVLAEVGAAGMEFSPLPPLAGGAQVRWQLRYARPWGNPPPRELLISGNGAGGLNLGAPVAGMKSLLPPAWGVLKRKVLVKDAYHDVYKVTDAAGEPLFYVYERNGSVWGLSIISESFKSARGIGIGNTLDQVRLHYPQVRLAYTGKKTPFIRVDGVDGIFIIQGGNEKRVISILIGESPEFE